MIKMKEIDFNDLVLEYKSSIMSQWMSTIIDRWILSKREHEFYKYWKITSVYIEVNERDYSYNRPSFNNDNVVILFQGYCCRMWDDDESRTYFLCQDETLTNFNFNRYELVSEKGMIESLDLVLAKKLLEDKVEDFTNDYDFDEYF